jgi:glycine cleavage system T protein (aminomethyltransferase)
VPDQDQTTETLMKTPLHAAHLALGARMAPFGGYDMPIQYKDGILAEHRWTRDSAGMFDVSHMGPGFLTLDVPAADMDQAHEKISALIETLIPGDVRALKPGKFKYSLLLNDRGGIVDDFMVGRPRDMGRQGVLPVVVNAGTKDHDFSLLEAACGGDASVHRTDMDGLIALQGPKAVDALSKVIPGVERMVFMDFDNFEWEGHTLAISRSGYTGEDGYEIAVPAKAAEALWDRLLEDELVRPIGLGARDSLRLEAGLPLYGHDLDETTSPIEAGLNFAVNKRRKENADFPGAERILAELNGGLKRVRVGLIVSGAPAREGAEIADEAGAVIGKVTSGGPSPTLGKNIAMGYVPPSHSQPGTRLKVIVRGRTQDAEVTPMPFVPHRYVRQAPGAQ